MNYRPDIDGLRALAILPVLAFHAGIDVIKGGFTGVDVFFVISGFLITRILVREIEAGQLTIAGFYKRRILRILPALIVVIAATLVTAWLLLLPNELRDTGSAAAAAGLSISNIWFWLDSGYFSSAAERNPLLHTWSLSVEEQFYLLFPFFLLLVHRLWPTRLRMAIIAVIILSFGLSILFIELAPEAAFYMLPMRAWELGAGALIAVGGMPRLAPTRAGIASAVGLVLVVVGFFAIDANDNFPGWGALLPVVGTTLLIAYGADGPVGRVMSLPWMAAIGRISYSL
jgi:peptidoglycan/LPS O-acetylase OafA/YrhL